jgi:hypothetical protein
VAELADMTLAAFLAAMGEDRPAPGAGSAAGAALAMGAACAAKAFRISARHRHDPAFAAAAEEAERLSRTAMACAQADADDFTALVHRQGSETALRIDGEALLAACDALRALVEAHRKAVVPALAGDLAAALALAEAARRIDRRNMAETA